MSFTMAAPAARRPPAPKPTAPLAPLAPVVKTVVLPGPRGPETWAAETPAGWPDAPGGEWLMRRVEDSGTTWQVVRKPATVVADFLGSLAQCRRYVGSGAAQEDLERQQAHERGEHEHERDRECERCAP